MCLDFTASTVPSCMGRQQESITIDITNKKVLDLLMTVLVIYQLISCCMFKL